MIMIMVLYYYCHLFNCLFIQCAARVKPPPYRNCEIVFRNLKSNRFEVSLKWRWKVIKICSKIVAKTVPNHGKSTSGAVLEDFGDPLGAQVAQERQQQLKNSKNDGTYSVPSLSLFCPYSGCHLFNCLFIIIIIVM
jgi:hypothetical protein